MKREKNYGWAVVLMISFLGCVGMGFCYLSGSLYIAPVCETFGIGRTQYGLITSTATLSGFLMSFFLGRLLKIFKKVKNIMIIGLLAAIFYLLVFYFSTGPTALYLAGILRGIYTTSTSAGFSSILISNWFEEKKAFAISVATAGSGIGGVAVPPFVEWLIKTYDWRTAALVSALILVVFTLPVAFCLKERPVRPEPETPGEIPPPPKPKPGMEVRVALKTPVFWMGVLAVICFAIIVSTYITNLYDILELTTLPRNMIAAVMSAVFLSNIAAKLVLGAFLEKFGIVKTVFFSMALYFIATFLVLNTGHVVMGFAFAILFGFSYNIMTAPVPLLVEQLFGLKHYSTFIGYYVAFMEIGFATSPMITGLSVDLTGRYDTALYIALGLAALCCVLVYFAVTRSKKYWPPEEAAPTPTEAASL